MQNEKIQKIVIILSTDVPVLPISIAIVSLLLFI